MADIWALLTVWASIGGQQQTWQRRENRLRQFCQQQDAETEQN